MKESIGLKEVLIWIIENSENKEAMNQINRVTYQFLRRKGGNSEN